MQCIDFKLNAHEFVGAAFSYDRQFENDKNFIKNVVAIENANKFW